MDTETPIEINLIYVRQDKEGNSLVVLPTELLNAFPQPLYPGQRLAVFTYETSFIVMPVEADDLMM